MTIRPCSWIWLLAMTFWPNLSHGAEPPTALGKVPADVEYFSSTLRLGVTIEIVGKSQAWKQIWEDPAVQGLRRKVLDGYAAEDFKPVRLFLTDPANAELPGLAADAFSHEFFFYTGASARVI